MSLLENIQQPRVYVALLGEGLPSLTRTPAQEYRGSHFKTKKHMYFNPNANRSYSRPVVIESITAPVLGYLPLMQRAEILWENGNAASEPSYRQGEGKDENEKSQSQIHRSGNGEADEMPPILSISDNASVPNLLGVTKDAQIDMELIHFAGAEPDDPKLHATFWAESLRKVKLVGLCFEAHDSEARRGVIDKWLPLIRLFLPSAPIIPIACWGSSTTNDQSITKDDIVKIGRKLESECVINYRHQQWSAEIVFDTLAWYAGRELSRKDRLLGLFKRKRAIKCVVT